MPFAVNGTIRIHYEVFGKGPPLFLHVGAFVEWDLWKLAGYIECLNDYELILIDPRGRGGSDRPRTLAAHQVERYVGDVISVLDDLDLSSVGFWGHSDGARVGYALALMHPDRLKALIAASGQDAANEYEDRVATAERIRKTGFRWLHDLIERSYGRKLPLWYAKQRRRRDRKIAELEMLAWRPWINKWDIYSKITVPTLITAGEKEDNTGLSKRIAERMPQARFSIFKGLGHLDAFMRSDVSTRSAAPFLRQNVS